ncbi:branched-chain amino acid ABC transporter substrate-binding protein [Herbaspirillum robiniae]|uniref:Branched-chain amino acid ABC transporter substrate-binding protein n=1 Tax=Herbaspirillum robiniae TaxID=2014887 RepID=A0A2D0B7F4_9BURK|nr:branched-chain amino acid ABC transporter substrate-binding protein [Herbaspirillum robiniae]NUU01725.1 branched-chain amino acid ABC transporter substrate-binding protein [Herbaspirillum robiniae]OWY30061.1 branched chain amino acid ABC transporter substrate-binding protein [Herbaspirillum robiniae]
MRKGFLLGAAALLAALGTCAGVAQAAPRTVVIGLAAPMSGLSGSTGVSLERAAQLAIDDVNEGKPVIGGEPVVFKLLPQDDRADPRTGELIAEYFVKSKVAAVVGHWNSGVGIPASKIYAAAGIPHVSPAVTAPAYTQQGFATAFRVVPHDGDGARHTAEYVLGEMKARSIVIIDDRTVFGAAYAAEFAKSVTALKGKVAAHYTVSSKTSDFNNILRSARSLNPDVVFFAGIDAQAAQLANDIRRLNIQAPLVGIGGLVGPTFLKLAGPAGEGTIVVEPGLPSYKGPQWTHFESAWKARYKEEIYLYAPFAYDAVRTIVAAMRDANSTDNAKVTAELHKIRYRGISGNIAFDKDGNLLDPVFTLYEVKGGRWRVIKTIGDKG